MEFSSNTDDYEDYSFGIFSVKFSTDGQELVAGSSDESIYVYDLESKRVSLRIKAHKVLNSILQYDVLLGVISLVMVWLKIGFGGWGENIFFMAGICLLSDTRDR